MIDTLRALTVAANSLRFNSEIDPDAAGRYEKVLTDLRDKLGRDMESNSLTLEELREMDGEPVWIVHTDYTPFGKEYWGIVRDGFSGLPNCFVATRDENIQLLYSEYGKTWLAYRRKPEEGEEHGSVQA